MINRLWMVALALLLWPALTWADITTNLTLRWKMDEGTGTTLTDSSGNARSATFASSPNDPAWLTGSANCGHSATACLDFDTGDDDLFTFTGIASGTTFTWATWIYPVAGNDDFAILLAQTDVDGFYYVGTGVDANKVLWDGSNYTSTVLTLNTWMHLAFVSNAGTTTWYINGVASGTGTATSLTYDTVGATSTSFNGRLKEMWFFSRALSSGDITELINATSATGQPRRRPLWFTATGGRWFTFVDALLGVAPGRRASVRPLSVICMGRRRCTTGP